MKNRKATLEVKHVSLFKFEQAEPSGFHTTHPTTTTIFTNTGTLTTTGTSFQGTNANNENHSSSKTDR